MAEKNSFTSSFRCLKWLGTNKGRGILFALALVFAANALAVHIADYVMEDSEQVIRLKRQWAASNELSRMVQDKDVVLFFGHSTVATGLVPEIFDRLNDNRVFSFNFALPGLPVGPSYYVLKDYLKKNPPPKYIVIRVVSDCFDAPMIPYYSPIGAHFWEVLQYSFLRRNADVFINYLFPMRLYWPEITKYVFVKFFYFISSTVFSHQRQEFERGGGRGIYNNSWDNMFRLQPRMFEDVAERRKDLLWTNRGYYYLASVAVPGGVLPDDFIPENNESPAAKDEGQTKRSKAAAASKDPFADKFFSLAQSKGIKVLVINDYMVKTNSAPAVDPGFNPQTWPQYPNVRTVRTSIKLYEPRYFSDASHANPLGAVRFSTDIAQEFLAAYGQDFINREREIAADRR